MPDSKLQFRGTIEIRGINPYVLVSAGQAEDLKPGWRRPMPVLVQVNGKPEIPWRINMMPVGDGDFFLYLHGDVRKVSGTGVGDVVEVTVEFDPQYRGGPGDAPAWFAEALQASPAAQDGWRALTPSRQKEIVRYLSRLKSAPAQQRNLEKVLHMLAGVEGRLMGRP
jgi:hypothetical protein